MMIHTLIDLLTLVHEFREQSVELTYYLRVDQDLCKFVPDGDHRTDHTKCLPYKVSRWDKVRIKVGRSAHTFQKVMTIPGDSLLFYSIFVILTR